MSDGIRQNLTNQRQDMIMQFFATIGLVLAGNDSEGARYGTTGTPEKYYLFWKEDPNANFIAYKQHKQNQNLQKQIANWDSANLFRQNVLEVYNAYFNGLRVVYLAIGNVANTFAIPLSLQQWVGELQKAYDTISYSYNQAKLMIDDVQLLQSLKTSFEKFNDLYNRVNQYYHSGLPFFYRKSVVCYLL